MGPGYCGVQCGKTRAIFALGPGLWIQIFNGAPGRLEIARAVVISLLRPRGWPERHSGASALAPPHNMQLEDWTPALGPGLAGTSPAAALSECN